jgi:hypothetical protein
VGQARLVGRLDHRRHLGERARVGEQLAREQRIEKSPEVFGCPGAEVKVYLVADPGERARRRLAERPEIGAEALATDLRLRDERDSAQMRPAPDAVTIDTTALTVEDVLDRIEALVRERVAT